MDRSGEVHTVKTTDTEQAQLKPLAKNIDYGVVNTSPKYSITIVG